MATTQAATKRMTVEEFWDFCQLPENRHKSHELRNGEVVEMSRPTTLHGFVAVEIAFRLRLYAREVRRGYVVGNDSGVLVDRQPGNVVGPDVAYFVGIKRYADMNPKWSDTPPRIAVEVLSPNDKPTEVAEKVELYLRNGVARVWVVDYELQRVTVYRADGFHHVLRSEEVLTDNEVLPGFQCGVAEFFRLPEETDETEAA